MQLRCAVTRRTSPEIAIKAMFTSRQFSSWLPIYSCCSLITMALRFGHKSSGSSSFRAVSPVLGFHGFQGIQTVTLSRRHKFRLFLVLEFVLPIRTFLMTIASNKRIKLELGAQAVWQFPTSSQKEVQLIVHVSRSLSDQFFRVGRSVVVLNLQHISAMFHSDVGSQLAHNRDWCQRWDELLSSICRHGLLEHQESHHSVHTHHSSREIQNLHNLGRADSTTGSNHVGRCHVHGTKPCRLRSRSHHRKAAEAPTTGRCAPVSVKPRAGPKTKPMNSGCFRSELHPTTVLDTPSYIM